MDGTALRADRADVRRTGDEHTLILSASGVHVMLIRLRYDGWVDEVIDGAGTVATWAVNAWTLIDHDLSLELGRPAAATLGVPCDLRVRLDVDDDAIGRVRAALLEILQSACFVVDTPEGRVTDWS
ncbi:hypothetical protein OHA72_39670 [Dactylosporangium sp. NBC_01737]|uniref:hypothetical protein n=1 Tax=Dactylosporangium sp. NBC_01737 TaxID=2975959 RepID=UPI002E118AAD|nr:hypothetical protein OHA72_39670 [Dactylosporangium sp. NBC_01737]